MTGRLAWDRWRLEAPIVVDVDVDDEAVRPSQTASDITKRVGSGDDVAALAPPWPWDARCEVRTLKGSLGRRPETIEPRTWRLTDHDPSRGVVHVVRLLEAALRHDDEVGRWIS